MQGVLGKQVLGWVDTSKQQLQKGSINHWELAGYLCHIPVSMPSWIIWFVYHYFYNRKLWPLCTTQFVSLCSMLLSTKSLHGSQPSVLCLALSVPSAPTPPEWNAASKPLPTRKQTSSLPNDEGIPSGGISLRWEPWESEIPAGISFAICLWAQVKSSRHNQLDSAY